MSRYTPIAQVKHRIDRAEHCWRDVVAIVTEEAAKPGYGGPAPAVVDRILDEIVTTQVSLTYWMAAVAMRAAHKSRRKTVREKAMEIVRREPQPPTDEGLRRDKNPEGRGDFNNASLDVLSSLDDFVAPGFDPDILKSFEEVTAVDPLDERK